MARFTVRQVISHKLIITYVDEFDVADQDKWNELRSMVSEFLEEEELSQIPTGAPSDPQDWLALYKNFPDQAFGEHESENLVTAENGQYDYWCELYDEKGKELE